MTNQRMAVIDMGTNTFHLLIGEASSKMSYKIFMDEKIAVKIGEGGISRSKITTEAQERGLSALLKFKKTIDHHRIDRVEVYATSALRSAENSKEFISRISKETGYVPKIINGLKEAEFIYYAVKTGLDLSNEPNLIMDIGGGSVEFIIGDNHNIYWSNSFEIGAQRLMDRFHRTEPISKSELDQLYSYFDRELNMLMKKMKETKPSTLIGVAGSFETLSEIFLIDKPALESTGSSAEAPFNIDKFKPIFKDLTIKTLEERIKTPGLIEFRAGMIVVALVLIDWVLQKNNFKHVRISRYSLKEGIFFSLINN